MAAVEDEKIALTLVRNTLDKIYKRIAPNAAKENNE
jgi:hypothetical protein